MKNGEQLTPVEWFFKQLTEVDYGCINKTFLQNNNSLAGHKLRELFEQAKAMEKEHSINLIVKYIEDNLDSSTHGNIENVKEWFELNK